MKSKHARKPESSYRRLLGHNRGLREALAGRIAGSESMAMALNGKDAQIRGLAGLLRERGEAYARLESLSEAYRQKAEAAQSERDRMELTLRAARAAHASDLARIYRSLAAATEFKRRRALDPLARAREYLTNLLWGWT